MDSETISRVQTASEHEHRTALQLNAERRGLNMGNACLTLHVMGGVRFNCFNVRVRVYVRGFCKCLFLYECFVRVCVCACASVCVQICVICLRVCACVCVWCECACFVHVYVYVCACVCVCVSVCVNICVWMSEWLWSVSRMLAVNRTSEIDQEHLGVVLKRDRENQGLL